MLEYAFRFETQEVQPNGASTSRSPSQLTDTFRSESTAASPAKRPAQSHVAVNGSSPLNQKKTASPMPKRLASADSNATFEDWNELDVSPKKACGSPSAPLSSPTLLLRVALQRKISPRSWRKLVERDMLKRLRKSSSEKKLSK